MRSLLTGIMIGAMPFLVSCGAENVSETKVIIGENDLSFYSVDDEITNSIGKMALGCTATHIGEGIVITAGHCLSSLTCNESHYDITWAFTKENPKGTHTSKCIEVIAHEFNYSTRDYAILRYENPPETSLKVQKGIRPEKGEKLTIFSHPNGVPLSWSGWCEHVGDHDQGDRFEYHCDTKRGSSGAAVLNEDYEIVGIHNQGSTYLGFNSGTYLMDIPEFKK